MLPRATRRGAPRRRRSSKSPGLLSLTPRCCRSPRRGVGYLPAYPEAGEVFLSDFLRCRGSGGEAIAARWERISRCVRKSPTAETARKEKVIGSGQDALVTIAPAPSADLFETSTRRSATR